MCKGVQKVCRLYLDAVCFVFKIFLFPDIWGCKTTHVRITIMASQRNFKITGPPSEILAVMCSN